MKQAQDYPITFPYGATTYPYGPTGYAGPYHRGDDRIMPVGTPVLVNAVQIGLSGATGEVTGSHLHIGRFVNGQDTNPKGQGFTLKSPVVAEVSSDLTNGRFVALNDADGVRWVYLHLSKQTVKVGQKLVPKGNDVTQADAHNVGTASYRTNLFREPESNNAAVNMGYKFGKDLTSKQSNQIVLAFNSIRTSPEWKALEAKVKK